MFTCRRGEVIGYSWFPVVCKLRDFLHSSFSAVPGLLMLGTPPRFMNKLHSVSSDP